MQNPNDEEEATINIPSSHDIFEKMLEEELRREEERMKSKGVSSVLNNGNKKSSEEAPLKPPLQSKKELSIHRSDKETSKKLPTTSPQDEFTVHQLEPTRSESPTLPSEPKSASKSNRTIALELDPIVAAEDTTEEQLLDHPSPIDNADVMITEVDLVESDMPPIIITGKDVNNFLTPATPLSSNALFEQMLQQELDNDSQIPNTEEKPLWKKQVEELDSLISRFKTADPNDNLFQESALNNKHPNVLEKGVETLLAFVDCAKYSHNTADKYIPLLIEKGFSAKPAVQAKSTEVILMFFEVSEPTFIVSILKNQFTNKKPKIRSQCISILRTALHDFGFPTIPEKPILNALPSILEDTSVREEANKLAVEVFRWMGVEAAELFLKDVKTNKMKALKEEFEQLRDKKPLPTRFSRVVTPSSKKANVLVSSEPVTDLKPEKETIDLMEKLRKDWFSDMENAKWSIRKDALDELKKLLERSNLKKGGDYSDIFSVVNIVLQREKNVAVIKEAIDCLACFAVAIKQELNIQAKSFYERLLSKVKEKKLADSTIECLTTFDKYVFPFTEVSETIFSALTSKAASSPEKLQILSLLDKCLQFKKKKDIEKPQKTLVTNIIVLCDDASSEVRDASSKLLARILSILGEGEAVITNIIKLDSHVKEKIVQHLEAFSGPETLIKKISQTIEQKKPLTLAPKVSSSVPRLPTRASTDVAKSATGTSTIIKKKLTSSTTKPLKQSVSTPPLSSSEVLDEAQSLFSEATLNNLASANWSDRLESLTTIENVIEGMDEALLKSKYEYIISLFQYKPGTKESNSKVLEKTFEIVEKVVGSIDCKISETSAQPLINWMVDKMITPKVDLACQQALKAFCESTSPQFVFNKISETLNDKPPKLIGLVLEWLSEVVTEFSVTCFTIVELIDFAKKHLGSSNPLIKKGCIKLLSAMKSYMGDGLLNFLGDVKPVLLTSVKKEFVKVDSAPPKPTRKVKGQTSISVQDSTNYDVLPRFDIVPKLIPKLYHNMEDKNWTIRLESLQSIEKIINDAHKRILPNILELLHALRQRLEDANIKVVSSTISLLELISESVGPEMDKFMKILVPSIVSKSMHNNKVVRTASLELLVKYMKLLPFEQMIKFFPKAITGDKGNPEGKKELLEFIYNHIPSMKTKTVDVFSPLVKPLLECLQASRPDTRKLSESILSEIINNGGFDYVYKQVRELKPAFQKSLAPLLQKYSSLSSETNVVECQASQNLSTPSANTNRVEKKMTLRDVSRSVNMEHKDDEVEASKAPKTVKKRAANISKTASPARSPSPNNVGPLIRPIVPKLQLGPVPIDEYKLDLDKIEVPLRPSTPEDNEPTLESYQSKGNTTPRMPERSPMKDPKKGIESDSYSVGELVKSIGVNEFGNTEQAISSLKTLVSMFKDESCRPAILSYLKELVESLTENTQYSFEKASAGLVTTRICKYLLSTLMALFSNRQMAAFVPQETLQRMVDQLLSRLLDERLPALDYGQELLRGLNSLMLKVLENSNRTFSYTSLIHLLEYSYANPSLKKYTELVVKCLIKLTKALAATIDRVDVDILLMDLHSFLTHNPPTFFKDRNDLPLRTIKTILNELVKVKGEMIRSCLNLIPTHKNPLIISYIDLMLSSQQSSPTPTSTTPQTQVPQTQTRSKTPLRSNPELTEQKQTQDELNEIFNLISNKDSTHTGLYRLYEFKKSHSQVNINPHLAKCSEPFQQYIHRQLSKISQYESAKQESTASAQRYQSPASRQKGVTSVDDIRRQLKLVQQESRQKSLGRSLTVSDLKKRIQNIEEKLNTGIDINDEEDI